VFAGLDRYKVNQSRPRSGRLVEKVLEDAGATSHYIRGRDVNSEWLDGYYCVLI